MATGKHSVTQSSHWQKPRLDLWRRRRPWSLTTLVIRECEPANAAVIAPACGHYCAVTPSAETKDLVGHAFVSPLPLGEGARGSSLLCQKRSLGHALGRSRHPAKRWVCPTFY